VLWLIKKIVPKPITAMVGMYGVFLRRLTTALTLAASHRPKAISEQASPVSINGKIDDDRSPLRALRESYDFEYAVLEQADKNKNTNFSFGDLQRLPTSWLIWKPRPLSNINK